MSKRAVLFSGQGAQYPGMAKELCDTLPAARAVFDIAQRVLGRDIAEICFNGTQEDLNFTHNTQPCVLATDLAYFEAAKDQGYVPDAVAGFSLGEYAALVVCGSLAIEDAFKIVQIRADAMQQSVPVGKGAMVAVMNLSLQQVQILCDEVQGYVAPANLNCPGQIVVSGEAAAIDELIEITRQRKIRAIKLPVSAPFHCNMMKPATEKLSVALQSIELSEPMIPIYMNVDAALTSSASEIRQKMVSQVANPVYWERTLMNMSANGFDSYMGLGPGKTLFGFVKRTLPDKQVMILEPIGGSDGKS